MESHGGNIYKIAAKLGYEPSEIIDFSANINPLGLHPEIKEIILRNMELLPHYPDPEYGDLRRAIGESHNIPYEFVIPGNGATETIFLYCRSRRPKRSLIVAPTFSEYERALRESGSEIVFHELKEERNFVPNFHEIMDRVDSSFDLVVLCNPNNPTGVLCHGEELLTLAKHGEKFGTDLMVDESFLEFREDCQEISLISSDVPSNIFILRSMTKIFAIPGLRVGYAISSNKKLMEKMTLLREPWTINILAAKVAQEMLDCRDYLEKTAQYLKDEIDFFIPKLRRLPWLKVYPPSVNYVLLKLLTPMTAAQLREKLLSKKILIRDASNFKFLDDKFLRIAIKDRSSNESLIKAMEEL